MIKASLPLSMGRCCKSPYAVKAEVQDGDWFVKTSNIVQKRCCLKGLSHWLAGSWFVRRMSPGVGIKIQHCIE